MKKLLIILLICSLLLSPTFADPCADVGKVIISVVNVAIYQDDDGNYVTSTGQPCSMDANGNLVFNFSSDYENRTVGSTPLGFDTIPFSDLTAEDLANPSEFDVHDKITSMDDINLMLEKSSVGNVDTTVIPTSEGGLSGESTVTIDGEKFSKNDKQGDGIAGASAAILSNPKFAEVTEAVMKEWINENNMTYKDFNDNVNGGKLTKEVLRRMKTYIEERMGYKETRTGYPAYDIDALVAATAGSLTTYTNTIEKSKENFALLKQQLADDDALGKFGFLKERLDLANSQFSEFIIGPNCVGSFNIPQAYTSKAK
jgi:hypothetical protein